MKKRTNNLIPWLMVLIALPIALFAWYLNGTAVKSTQTDSLLYEQNEYRAKISLERLATDATLMRLAQEKANDMATKNYFDHTSPEGITFGQRMKEYTGAGASMAGENLAAGYSSAGAVINGWHNSEGHRINMQEPKWRAIGVGYAYSADSIYKHYWVTLYGDKVTSVLSTAAFEDIQGHYGQTDIEAAAAKGWIRGYPDGTFQPNAPITRAEVVIILRRLGF